MKKPTSETELKEDIKLAKEVNWLYDRLDKKEFNILMKWVWANCEVIKQQAKSDCLKEVNEIINYWKRTWENDKDAMFNEGYMEELFNGIKQKLGEIGK